MVENQPYEKRGLLGIPAPWMDRLKGTVSCTKNIFLGIFVVTIVVHWWARPEGLAVTTNENLTSSIWASDANNAGFHYVQLTIDVVPGTNREMKSGLARYVPKLMDRREKVEIAVNPDPMSAGHPLLNCLIRGGKARNRGEEIKPIDEWRPTLVDGRNQSLSKVSCYSPITVQPTKPLTFVITATSAVDVNASLLTSIFDFDEDNVLVKFAGYLLSRAPTTQKIAEIELHFDTKEAVANGSSKKKIDIREVGGATLGTVTLGIAATRSPLLASEQIPVEVTKLHDQLVGLTGLEPRKHLLIDKFATFSNKRTTSFHQDLEFLLERMLRYADGHVLKDSNYWQEIVQKTIPDDMCGLDYRALKEELRLAPLDAAILVHVIHSETPTYDAGKFNAPSVSRCGNAEFDGIRDDNHFPDFVAVVDPTPPLPSTNLDPCNTPGSTVADCLDSIFRGFLMAAKGIEGNDRLDFVVRNGNRTIDLSIDHQTISSTSADVRRKLLGEILEITADNTNQIPNIGCYLRLSKSRSISFYWQKVRPQAYRMTIQVDEKNRITMISSHRARPGDIDFISRTFREATSCRENFFYDIADYYDLDSPPTEYNLSRFFK